MKETSIKEKILNIMKTTKLGQSVIYSDFYDLASPNTIRVSIKRLCQNQEIKRLLDGVFVVPYYSETINKVVLPSSYNVAEAIARKNNWNIYPSVNNAMNVVGFSTQVPANYEFICDGNYRTYAYLETKIIFKRLSNRKIKDHSPKLSTLVIALDGLGKKQMDQRLYKVAKEFVRKNIDLAELENSQIQTLPNWMFDILSKIRMDIQVNA